MMALRIFADCSTAVKCASLFPSTVSSCNELLSKAKERALLSLGKIYEIDAKERTFTNTVEHIDISTTELNISQSLLSVISSVFPIKEVRDEANKHLIELSLFKIDQFTSNRRLFEALKVVSASDAYQAEYVNNEACSKEYAYCLEEMLMEYRRSGMELPEEAFYKVIQLQKDIETACRTFLKNISEDKTQLFFFADALKGVPENILTSLKKNEAGEYILGMDYPTFFGVMRSCEISETRQAMFCAFRKRAYPVNETLLRSIISTRHQMAIMLGYPSYAHFNLSDKMAKTPGTADKFLNSLLPMLEKKWANELELLKNNLHPSCILSKEGAIHSYDIPFSINKVKETLFNVDETKIQEYFPLDTAINALFYIYQSFFEITFHRIDNGDDLWHETVFTLKVTDNVTSKLLGHIILDLFPRSGKFTHACCHSVIPPVRLEGSENDFSPALSVVIANFPMATEDKPALLLHSDATTFFHEFGHAIHGLMGRCRVSTFAGTNVKTDFVELPSQMLEEWLWNPEILQAVTSHYKTKEPMPEELIKAKIRSQNAFSGNFYLNQMQYGIFSLSIFGLPFSAQPEDKLNAADLFYSIESAILPNVIHERNIHFECSFGHLTGYGSAYYGYMWSKVFALDLFEYIKTRRGLLDSKLGRQYTNCIIGVGGGKDPIELIRAFLGRDPENEAFIRNITI